MDWIFDPAKFAEVLKELDGDAVKPKPIQELIKELERDADSDRR